MKKIYFKHLHVPETWRHYWSKYPEGYTILESLMSWVSQVDGMVDQLNKNTDEIINNREELEKIIADFITDINNKLKDFLDRFEGDLKKEVGDLLTDWLNDGTLENIINQTILNKKMDKDEAIDLINMPQGTTPQGQFVDNTHKIIHKVDDKTFYVFQKTNKGYVKYTLSQSGASSPSDYGVNHELTRIHAVEPVDDIYVYYDIGTPMDGEIGQYNGEGIFNSFESNYFFLPRYEASGDKNVSSKAGLGTGVYIIEPGNHATYELPSTHHKTMDILIMGTTGSGLMEISVNDVVVKTVDPRLFVSKDSLSYGVVSVDVPSYRSISGKKFNLMIKNTASTGRIYPIAFNLSTLSEYTGKPITDYKAFGTYNEGWITSSGASDYALYDQDKGKWFGSYHGGEVNLYNRITWNSNMLLPGNEGIQHVTIESIEQGAWTIQKILTLYQRNELAEGKATMTSIFEWNSDSGIKQSSSYKGSVKLGNFYTAITSIHPTFNYVMYPEFKYLGNTPTLEKIMLPTTEGYVKQLSVPQGLEVETFFTRFNNYKAQSKYPYILDHTTYRKLYYTVVNIPYAHVIDNLTFSKQTNFIRR